MWRRIPILPILFGASGALAILAVFSIGEPLLVGWRPYVAAAAVGAAYVLSLYACAVIFRPPQSAMGGVGWGCFYAATGFMFLTVVILVGAIATDRSVKIKGAAGIAALLGFVILGILAGVILARFRRAETDRQRAALERQQLAVARDLQQRLLPPPVLESDRYRVTARNVPAEYIAGDFYDFVPLGSDRLLLVLADVAGKGVSAGLIMATVKAIIPLLAAEQPNPAPLLGRLNERLTGQFEPREFVAVTLALLDVEKQTLTVANAGLPDPVVIGTLQPIAVQGPRYPIGIRKSLGYESLTVKVAPGDKVIFFTDGLPEATIKGEPLGYERLVKELGNAQGEIEKLFAALDHLGAAHDDDWTAVLLEYR